MWKESLCIGVEKIDRQHKSLFTKIEELINELQGTGTDKKQKCTDAIVYLKEYAFQHFEDEEAYQQSIGYKYYPAHKKLHEKLIKTLLDHERKMTQSDFADSDIKAFTGMLIAWLLYHVADADQKIGKDAPITEKLHAHNDIVYFSVCDVFNKMAGFDLQDMRWVETPQAPPDDSLAFKVALTGDVEGYVTFIFPIAFVKKMMEAMLGFEPEGIGELELSALCEISNIICGTICSHISEDEDMTCDISTPLIIEKSQIGTDERIVVDTGSGIVDVGVLIK